MSASDPHILNHALAYARRGLKVFPVYEPFGNVCSCGNPDCGSPGKHPRTEHGLKDATSDAARIRAWWKQWPEANIGIETSGMVVVDVDAKHQGYASLDKLETDYGTLPATWRTDTGGGGAHFLYRRNGHQGIGNKAGIRPGVDIKTDGGYIVAPPSLHVSGRRYAWAKESGRKLADFPQAWMKLFAEHRERTSEAKDASAKFEAGKRNAALTSLAGSMRRRGMSEAAILAALLTENSARCEPPLPESEVRRIAESIGRYEPKEKTEPAEEPRTEFQYIEFAPVFLAVEDPPTRYLINELLPEAVISLDHGEPRTRKTWAALGMAMAAATGIPAFGMDRFTVPQAVPVLYSSQEDAAPLVRLRARALLKGIGIDRYPETLAFAVHKGIDLGSHEWHEALIRDVLKYGFRLVIFDPIRRYSPDVDKGPAEVHKVTAYLRRLAVETGAAVKIVHHDVKPKADGRDDRRRSHKASGGDWFAAAECPVSYELAGQDSTLVIPEDFKISRDPEPFSFRLETDDDRNPTIARLLGETSSAEDSKILAMQQKILGYLAEHPGGGSGSAIAKSIRIRKEDVLAGLNVMLKSEEVDCFGGGGNGKRQTWFLKQKEEK